ncbi:MAG TPA: dephospho-CoA kinase [Myxococcota bacterium]|nr:dephospho-CoA kinase [Myxococcota bacterium]
MTRVIGLTGGIGTGKSSVAAMLAELGARVIDSDAIVHELQAPGMPLLAELAAEFGPGILRADGSLDRAALGDRVFRDETARKRLNAIVHPAVGRESAKRLAEALASGVPLVVLDIPLLFETRAHGTASKANLGIETIVVVWAPRALQIERQLARNGYGRDEAERRVDAQIPIDEKRAQAHHVIDNSGSLEDTQRQVRELYAELTA